ncbi:hypothetical protein HRR99_05885 [Agrobacterium vaccinii]|uniref:hypothetical protein n=1 Tax=Agrobacterium vaccinii TaxID=2735528 RepID=UPI001E49F6B0|nr:hypothetical protein [Agrobacterium vaccinii]UHS61076.1 hypothetical protein HRR99_05885 [Agrobacterium vaccinii]
MASGLVSYVQLLSTELALKAIEQQQERSVALLPTEIDQPYDSTAASAVDEAAPVSSAPLISLVPETPEADDDITGAPFMRSLKAWIGELSADHASVNQGNAMAQSLTSGTLKIHDPVEGVAITAWDVSGERPHTIQRDEINAVGWSQFLKQRVKRGEAGYAKDADGNYMDVISGQSAYFGAVGSKFYYLTWPKMNAEV